MDIMATNAEAARRSRIAYLLAFSKAALPPKPAAIHLSIVSRYSPFSHSQSGAGVSFLWEIAKAELKPKLGLAYARHALRDSHASRAYYR
jgi:hypothetical protein